MIKDYDKGPNKRLGRLFAKVPDHSAHAEHYWYDWEMVFYRGRSNRRLRLMVIASDPGPTERLIGRSLIGDAGQRVQGFMWKLGLTSSYICVNAHPYSLHPSHFSHGKSILRDPAIRAWRNRTYDACIGPDLQAIVAFGSQAHRAVELWDTRPDVPLFEVRHPSSRNPEELADGWRAAITALRGIITPEDPAGHAEPNYGPEVTLADYADIPRGDLPFGTPSFIGRDQPKKNRPLRDSTVSRKGEDQIIWRLPDQGSDGEVGV